VAAEVLDQHRPDARIVVDDEKASAAVHARSPSCGPSVRAVRVERHHERHAIQNDNTRCARRRIADTGAFDTLATLQGMGPGDERL
jgi:hypothetical protein